ncbi:MAG: CinA family nicotinamide mononucleotide deamidase-related protein [Gemmatimonadota bacterium]|nr:CinA family nicotinamide mononucleotide deamidase-related protein [Gemmatimonadota bacterium]
MQGTVAQPRAAIVSVGNELLYGETVDTNAAWLGRWLGELGITVVRRFTVGDRRADIDEALERALEAADLVILSGGLGPTPDDLTKSVVADHFGLGLVVVDSVVRRLEEHFRAGGYDEVPPLSLGQAELPEGAIPLRNPSGTAPGILLSRDRARIVLLPGVPHELRDIAAGDLADELDAWLGPESRHRAHHRVIHTTGLAETSLAQRLEPRLQALGREMTGGVDLAYLPDLRGVDLRFTLAGGTAQEAAERFDRLLGALDDVLGPWRFEGESGDIADALSVALRARGWRLAVAESCTGGLVGKRLTDRPGASDVFVGGVIAYDDAVKVDLLGVDRERLERDGAVSEAVARQLAKGVAERLGVETGVGVTGVAGPGGGSDEKPVGTVWISTAVQGDVEVTLHRFAGDREAVRERAAQAALASLYRRLTATSGSD